MDLRDKIVVITGASHGLGRSLAESLNKESVKLILIARSRKDIEAVTKDLAGSVPVAADVTSESAMMKVTDFIIKKFGRLDIWINNAGIWTPHAPIEEQKTQKIRDMLEVNLFGLIFGSKAALIKMKKQHDGIIINILSTSALTGRAGSSGYCASKYAATGFTKSLRLEAQPENIKIIAVYPGGMRTNFFDEKKPLDYDKYMDPNFVAEKIVNNLKMDQPEEELIIKRNP